MHLLLPSMSVLQQGAGRDPLPAGRDICVVWVPQHLFISIDVRQLHGTARVGCTHAASDLRLLHRAEKTDVDGSSSQEARLMNCSIVEHFAAVDER